MSLTIHYEGRREVVKPTPTQSLSVILQRACEKFKIAPSNYALYDAKGKELDLSLSYRLSGLASGAKLEIKRRAAKTTRASVMVGLQLPEGGRVQATFPANTRLWDVLLHFEQQGEGKLNLTKRVTAAGTGEKRKADEPAEGHYMLPALTYLQREVATVEDLYRNTLQDLGLDGNGLLRLNFRPTEGTLEAVQAELEAIRTSEVQRQEEHKKAEEEKARRRAAEEEKMKRLREESEKMRDTEREELLRRAKEEADAEEEQRRKQEIERLVAQKEKEMEETFREMERAALEQTQVEHMRAAMRAHFGQSGSSSASTSTSTSTTTATTRSPEPKDRESDDRMEVEAQPSRPTPAKKEPARLEIPDRELRVLPPTDRPFNPKEFEVPESFYEATTDDYRVALQAIKANRMRMEEESQMRTKEMKEKDRLRRIPKYRKTLIKVRFPNRVEVQATFHPLEKAQAVFDVIKDSLAHPDRPFYLFTTPPKERVDLTKSLLSLVMVPAAIIYFSWEDNSGPAVEYIKEELVRDIADQIPAPVSFPQSQPTPSSTGSALATLGHVLGFSSTSSSSSSSSTSQPEPPPARQPPRGGARDYSNVVPKWFAAGRK